MHCTSYWPSSLFNQYITFVLYFMCRPAAVYSTHHDSLFNGVHFTWRWKKQNVYTACCLFCLSLTYWTFHLRWQTRVLALKVWYTYWVWDTYWWPRQGRRFCGGGLDPVKICRRGFDPSKKSHSFTQNLWDNSASFTSSMMKDLRQKLEGKTNSRGA